MLDLLLLFFLVVIIANKLFSILGKVDGDPTNQDRQNSSWAADLLRRAQEASQAHKRKTTNNIKELVDVDVISPIEATLSPTARDNFKLLKEIEPGFDLEKFETGVKKVFVMIIDAICSDNKKVLQHLLTNNLYQELCDQIDNRTKEKKVLKQHIVTIRKIDIEDLGTSKIGNQLVARIDVAITSQQTRVVYGAEGKVIEGKEEKVELVTSHWSFTKNIGVGDSIWRLQKM